MYRYTTLCGKDELLLNISFQAKSIQRYIESTLSNSEQVLTSFYVLPDFRNYALLRVLSLLPLEMLLLLSRPIKSIYRVKYILIFSGAICQLFFPISQGNISLNSSKKFISEILVVQNDTEQSLQRLFTKISIQALCKRSGFFHLTST